MKEIKALMEKKDEENKQKLNNINNLMKKQTIDFIITQFFQVKTRKILEIRKSNYLKI